MRFHRFHFNCSPVQYNSEIENYYYLIFQQVPQCQERNFDSVGHLCIQNALSYNSHM
jgi:hypothetical protein